MIENPVNFDKLIFPRGGGAKGAAWRGWSVMLARMLKSATFTVPQIGFLEVDHTGPAAILRTTRPIPAYILARTGASGIPIRNASTGAWGAGTVTLYRTTIASGVRQSVLGSTTLTAYNDTAVAIPALKDVKCIEQGGDLIVIAVIC